MNYAKQWQSYRNHRNWFWLICASYLPGVYFGSLSVSYFVPSFHEQSFLLLALMWMAGFAYTGIKVNTWPCPRCGQRFSARDNYNLSLLARKCVHCGLPKLALTAK